MTNLAIACIAFPIGAIAGVFGGVIVRAIQHHRPVLDRSLIANFFIGGCVAFAVSLIGNSMGWF